MRLRLLVLVFVGAAGCGGGAGRVAAPPTARVAPADVGAGAGAGEPSRSGRSIEHQHRLYHAAMVAAEPVVVTEIELELGLEGSAARSFRERHGTWVNARKDWIARHLPNASEARGYLARELPDKQLSWPRIFSPAEEQAHREFQAAVVVGDPGLMMQVLIAHGLAQPSGAVTRAMEPFARLHGNWIMANMGWVQTSLGDPGQAYRWLMMNSRVGGPPPGWPGPGPGSGPTP